MAAQGIGSTILYSNAIDFDHQDWVEILSVLPPHEGKSVLEIGPDIGPFTTELAKKAAHVLALNVIPNIATNKNGSVNNELEKNVKFMNVDVNSCDLNVSPNSIDLIYSNSLLIHLVDEEAVDMVQKMLKWLKPGGYILFRESCFPPSTEEHKGGNSSRYREPSFYMKVFKECHVQDESGSTYELSLVCGKCIGFHGRNENGGNQICWLWEKAQSEVDKGFQGFLDNSQYKYTGILRYERIFGPGFVSTGGIETTREFVSKLDLKPGEKVLDVGCGIGGGDFYMAERFGVEVVGIDLSINMISLALERSVGLRFPVEFEVADCTKRIYPDNTFHVIYSRDTILHIQDKPALFRSFYKWLKPGGQVLITDYCKKAGEPSPEFAQYIKQRGYDLHDVQAYGQMLRDAGFDEVIAEDRTDQFIQVLERELELVEKDKDKFINDFSEEDYNDIVDGWKAKMVRTASAGEQRWGLFIAKKT